MAQNIWDDACKNTLQKPGRIDRYLRDDPDCINKVGSNNLTPLAGACFYGHFDVVTLLLEKGARPNERCPHGRTALFHVMKQAPRYQQEIVKALLKAGADPNEVYPEDDNANALTIAIDEAQDKDLVYALMDAGAKPTEENKKKAKKKKMETALQPWKDIVGTFVDLAASAVSLVVAYTDGGVISAITKGAMKKMYKITNPQSNPVAADIPAPKSAQDFKKNIGNFVKKSGLERFFAKKPQFLQALAERASLLRNDTTTDLGKPENLQRLTNLSLYQLVIYCDDSGSMGYSSDIPGQIKTRYQNQCELVSRITNVATKLLPDDTVVKVRFINNPFDRDVTMSEVGRVMSDGFRGGSTPLGNQLVRKIIQPLVYDKISTPGFVFEQPLLICTITDGSPDGGDIPIRKVVSDCRAALDSKKYDPTSVMFCISQIGTDSGAKSFLDSLRNDDTIKDVVYCTTDQLDVKLAELRDQERELEVWLLDMLTKPIMRNRL